MSERASAVVQSRSRAVMQSSSRAVQAGQEVGRSMLYGHNIFFLAGNNDINF